MEVHDYIFVSREHIVWPPIFNINYCTLKGPPAQMFHIIIWRSQLSISRCSVPSLIKVAGHPAHSAARLCIEIEWDHVDLSLPSKSMADIPQFKQTDCPQTSLAASGGDSSSASS